jgi:predicted transcriptional regulator
MRLHINLVYSYGNKSLELKSPNQTQIISVSSLKQRAPPASAIDHKSAGQIRRHPVSPRKQVQSDAICCLYAGSRDKIYVSSARLPKDI